MTTNRLPLHMIFLLTFTACPPDDGETTNETTSGTATPTNPTIAPGTTETPDPGTSTSIPTTGEHDTSTTSVTSTSTTGIAGGPCDGIPNNPECMCEGTDDAFCAKLDNFCRTEVGLDLSPDTDYCDTITEWCNTPGTNTYAVCFLLESTCMQVAPSGDVTDCAGLQTVCACDDFVIDDTTSGLAETSGGMDTETGMDALPVNFVPDKCDLPKAGSL